MTVTDLHNGYVKIEPSHDKRLKCVGDDKTYLVVIIKSKDINKVSEV